MVGVVDGDTLVVQIKDGSRLTLRLHGIDAPERDQPHSDEALRTLNELVGGRTVRFEVIDIDRYGRTVARVHVGDTDANAELVRRGAAWVYRRYSDDPVLLASEREARAEKRGLWARPASERVPPWDWRRGDRTPKAVPEASCGRKSLCREMSSCSEARFHLETCGLKRLDGDGDGIPCESLCN